MKNKPIIIVSGEPFSIFLEIFFKLYKLKFIKKYKYPIILIASEKLVREQMKHLGFKIKIKLIDQKKIHKNNFSNNQINLINVKLNYKKPFDKITSKSSQYIKKCFEVGLNLIVSKKSSILINGPISKKHFLGKNHLGITEFLAKKTGKTGKEVMLIYNKFLSVCPVTTHLPLKKVARELSKEKIVYKINCINKFYKKNLKKKPRFGVSGLNPHCESNYINSEEANIIKPAIKILRKKSIKVEGPFPADTLFLKKNLNKFDIIVGMYHDQVLAPMKSLFEFNAINITLGLPFIRISPDHGTNHQMIGKNKSDPASLKEAFNFLKKLNVN